MTDSDASHNTQLVASVKCSLIISNSEKKRACIRLVRVPASDLDRRRVSSVSSTSKKGTHDPKSLVCGANLEMYEYGLLGKRKLIHVWNIADLCEVAVQQNTPSKRKLPESVLDLSFKDTAVKLIFDDSKKDEAETWCGRFKQIKEECEKLFKWKINQVFTENSVYTGSYGVYVLTEIPGISVEQSYEMKILFECVLLHKMSSEVENDETPNSVVMYWPITSLKKFGLHAQDKHLFAIEYSLPGRESTHLSTCIFKSAFALSLVEQISARVAKLDKVDMTGIYSDVDKTNRRSRMPSDAMAVKLRTSDGDSDGAHHRTLSDTSETPVVPPRNYLLGSKENIYSSCSGSEKSINAVLDEGVSGRSAKPPRRNPNSFEVQAPEYFDIDKDAEQLGEYAESNYSVGPSVSEHNGENDKHYDSVSVLRIDRETAMRDFQEPQPTQPSRQKALEAPSSSKSPRLRRKSDGNPSKGERATHQVYEL